MEDEAKQLLDADADSNIAEDIGDIHVADEVICIVASLAAQEIRGVYSMSGGLTDEINSFLGKENASKGVRIRYEGKQVRVIVYLNLEYGYCFPEVALAVQEKVKKAIEELTGYDVQFVDVHVEGVIKPQGKPAAADVGSSVEAMEEIMQAQAQIAEARSADSYEMQLRAMDGEEEESQRPYKARTSQDEEDEDYYPERKYFQIGEEDTSVSAAERHRKFWEED